jgi:hypothetical protein
MLFIYAALALLLVCVIGDSIYAEVGLSRDACEGKYRVSRLLSCYCRQNDVDIITYICGYIYVEELSEEEGSTRVAV